MKKKSSRILVIDDDPNVAELVSVNMREENCRIEAAYNGEEALEKTVYSGNDNPPDIIILDVILPGINGYEIARHIKTNPQYRETSIIMLTAKSQPLDKYVGLVTCNVRHYLTKPFDINDLLILIMKELREKDFVM